MKQGLVQNLLHRGATMMADLTAKAPDAVSDEVLRKRADLMVRAYRISANEDFLALREYQREVIAQEKDMLIAMPVDEFVDGKGIELKGKIIGRQKSLNVIANIIIAGEDAQRKLATRQAKAQEQQQKDHNRVATRPI